MISHVYPLPDETMRDIRIVHDAVGVYADWLCVGALPYGRGREDYITGKLKPNYPMPAKIEYVIWDCEFPYDPFVIHDDIANDRIAFVGDFIS